MEWIAEAFERKWFFIGALVLAVIYGFGALVHVGNIMGFGEVKWSQAPISWKFGDVWWGMLDIVAVVGIVVKSPVGLGALGVAALSQVVAYGFFPQLFAVTDTHYSTLRGLAYFNGIVLVGLCVALYVAGGRSGA